MRTRGILELFLFMFLVGFSIAFPEFVEPDGDNLMINNCTELNESGIYYLNGSFSSLGTCFNITVRDVHIEGNGHNLSYGGADYYGIYSNMENTSISNLSVFSNVAGEGYGVYFDGANNSAVLGVNSSGNGYGVYLESVWESNFSDLSIEENSDKGLNCFSCFNNSFSEINSFENFYGVYFYESEENILVNINSSYNGHSGVFLSSSFNNYFGEAYSQYNLDYGFYLSGGSENIVNNSNFLENNFSDFEVFFSDLGCNNLIENVNGSGGRPIGFYNYSVELSDEEFSQLILCGANNSNLTNVSVRGSEEIKNNGLIVIETSFANFSEINSSNNYYGAFLLNSNNNSFEDSFFDKNLAGFSIQSSSNNTLKNNSMIENEISDFNISFESSYFGFENDIDSTNLVTGNKKIYYNYSISGYEYNLTSAEDVGMVFCFNCENITVRDLEFNDTRGVAVYLGGTNNSEIYNVSVWDSLSGVALLESINISVDNLFLFGNGGDGFGLSIEDSEEIFVFNSIFNNFSRGATLEDSFNCSFENITAKYNPFGLEILSAHSNSFSLAVLEENRYGVYERNSYNNSFIDASFSGNDLDRFSFTREDYLFYFGNFGRVDWTEEEIINSSETQGVIEGESFYNNFKLGRGFAFLNSSSVSLLNGSANITLNITGMGITNPKILRNGVDCVLAYCSWIDSDSSDGIIKFNVSSWSNYSIVQVPSSSSSDSDNTQNTNTDSGAQTTTVSEDDADDEDFWVRTYRIRASDFEEDAYEIEMSRREQARIEINGENYYFGLISVDSNSVSFNISSVIGQTQIYVGDEKKFDVDEDGFYDLKIFLEEIEGGYAKFIFYLISEDVLAEVASLEGAGNSINSTGDLGALDEGVGSYSLLVFLGGIVFVLVMGSILSYLLFFKKKE